MQGKKTSGFGAFLKRNAALVVIIVCVMAISGIVIIGSLNNKPDGPDDEDPGDDDPVVTPPITWALPITSYEIGRDYSATEFSFNETLNEWTIHKAIDFIAKESTNVTAIQDGTVESIKTDLLRGTVIVINHGNGIKAIYGSLSSEASVVVGQTVKKGDKIGVASDSAYNEFKMGNHLHLEMTKDNVFVNPRDYLDVDKGITVTGTKLNFINRKQQMLTA